MEKQKKEQRRSNENDDESDPLRPTDGSPVEPREQGPQIHAGQSDAVSRPKGKTAADQEREDLPSAGRGVRADRVGRDPADEDERPTSPVADADRSEAQEQDSSGDRKPKARQARAVTKDDE